MDFLFNALLFILLLGVTGLWFFDRVKGQKNKLPNFSGEYFRGLNYIINEEQDKAISIFTKMMTDSPETIETQIALGALFRRRGESARAISIHKALIDDDTININQKQEALLELGRDYMKAGMLDRAEKPFIELVKANEYKHNALISLSQIYDQEQDWDKAIDAVNELYRISKDVKWRTISAHYWCEKAHKSLKNGAHSKAISELNTAFKNDNTCVRASILKAQSMQEQEKHLEALAIYRHICQMSPNYIPEILQTMIVCLDSQKNPNEVINELSALFDAHPNTSLLIALADKVRTEKGIIAAEKVLAKALKKQASVRGLEALIALNLEKVTNAKDKHNLKSLQSMMAELREEKSTHKCNYCGFEALKLHWQCPSCRQWSAIEPIVGVSGE